MTQIIKTTQLDPCDLCAVRDAIQIRQLAHINRLRRFAISEVGVAIDILESDLPKDAAIDSLRTILRLLNKMPTDLQQPKGA
jgi:hypothetical protein